MEFDKQFTARTWKPNTSTSSIVITIPRKNVIQNSLQLNEEYVFKIIGKADTKRDIEIKEDKKNGSGISKLF